MKFLKRSTWKRKKIVSRSFLVSVIITHLSEKHWYAGNPSKPGNQQDWRREKTESLPTQQCPCAVSGHRGLKSSRDCHSGESVLEILQCCCGWSLFWNSTVITCEGPKGNQQRTKTSAVPGSGDSLHQLPLFSSLGGKSPPYFPTHPKKGLELCMVTISRKRCVCWGCGESKIFNWCLVSLQSSTVCYFLTCMLVESVK